MSYFCVVYFLSTSAHVIVITHILYKSLMVSQQLKTLSQMKGMRIIFENICKIQESIKRFDSLIGFYNLLMLSVGTMLCISSVCMLAIVPDINAVSSASHLLIGFSMISVHCFICQLIPNSFNDFLNSLKNRYKELNENKSDSEQQLNHIIMIRLNEMKDEMCFTAFNLFKLNANTLLSCVALIITYSIIIIQTNQSNVLITPSNCTCN